MDLADQTLGPAMDLVVVELASAVRATPLVEKQDRHLQGIVETSKAEEVLGTRNQQD